MYHHFDLWPFSNRHSEYAQNSVLIWFGQILRIFLLTGALISTATLVKATSVEAPEFTELVNESDYIVRAVVKSVTSQYAKPSSKKIITKVELDVIDVIAGKPPQPLILQVLGGKVGQDEMILDGAPKFTEGDEGIYFVQNNGKQIYPLVAIMHGIYPIKVEAEVGREYMTRSNDVPLENSAEVSLPMTDGAAAAIQRRMHTPARALTPKEFMNEIRAAVKPDNKRLNEK